MGEKNKKGKISRRDILKGIATVPLLGAFGYALYRKKQYDNYIKGNLVNEIGLSYEAPKAAIWKIKSSDKLIRIGIIGFGSRGEDIIKASGFAHPDKIKKIKDAAESNNGDTRFDDYQNQDHLNIVINGICDLFDVRAERAMTAAANHMRTWDIEKIDKKQPIRYKNYKELLASPDIDAVIIATSDHWHAQIAIDAAKAGKHVYVEKAMTKTIEEAYRVRDAVKQGGIVFQLGHQGRQTESYIKAKEAIQKNLLGKISLIQVSTNRNDPNGAWVYDIHPEGNEKTIDWNQFLGNAPKIPFSPERFFRWRCWWDYGTGLSGDLFTHEYDGVNQIMELGIPHSVVSSGGIYFYKDGRTVPDTYQVACEYPDRDLTLLYSGTLSSDKYRGKIFMGHDANMEVSEKLIINAEEKSTRYKEKINAGIINSKLPLYSYKPGMKDVDAITSATEAYFAGRGLLYTYRDGKKYDTTFLHIKEWLDCIRNNGTPSCNIDQGFQEAIAAHMGTLSYLENRKVFWDKEKEIVI